MLPSSIELPANLVPIVQVILFLLGAYLLAFWLSMVIWTLVDIRSRSRDILTALLSVLLVLVFGIPGLVIYFILRPKETLTQAYQRALEEEALFPILLASGRPELHQTVARLRQEHLSDSDTAGEVSEAVHALVTGHAIVSPDALGYLLRSFFGSMRRTASYSTRSG